MLQDLFIQSDSFAQNYKYQYKQINQTSSSDIPSAHKEQNVGESLQVMAHSI